MKSLLIFIFLSLISCSQVQDKKTSKKYDIFPNIKTEELLIKLYKLWDSKSGKSIEPEIGNANNKKIENSLIVYSYLAKLEIPYEQLFFKVGQDDRIESISYEVLDEQNELLNDQWILNNFKSNEWKLVELPQKTHTIIPKMVLVNYEKKILAGYVKGYKNNQLRFVYFGEIDNKKLDHFKWE